MFSRDPGPQIAMCSNLWEQIQNRSHRFKSETTYCNMWEQIAIVGNRFESVGTDSKPFLQMRIGGHRLHCVGTGCNLNNGHLIKSVGTDSKPFPHNYSHMFPQIAICGNSSVSFKCPFKKYVGIHINRGVLLLIAQSMHSQLSWNCTSNSFLWCGDSPVIFINKYFIV